MSVMPDPQDIAALRETAEAVEGSEAAQDATRATNTRSTGTGATASLEIRNGTVQLQRLALEATPGPWRVHGIRETYDGVGSVVAGSSKHPVPERFVAHYVPAADARFIAATSPDVVLALLSDLEAERERGRALRAAVEMLAEEFHEVAQSITNLDAASLGRQSVWQSCSRQTRALLATPVPSPLAEVRDDRERRGANG